MALYCGIDLHSNNHVIVVIDEHDQRIEERRIDNDLIHTLSVLSSVELNRNEGYEVLYFLNKIGENAKLQSQEYLLKFEELIKTELPSYIRKRSNVRNWLINRISS